MLGDLSHVEKIYIRCGYTDMRKQLNGLLDIIQYNFKRETVSAFYTNGTKTDVSNGRGPAKKQNRFLISSCAGFWKV